MKKDLETTKCLINPTWYIWGNKYQTTSIRACTKIRSNKQRRPLLKNQPTDTTACFEGPMSTTPDASSQPPANPTTTALPRDATTPHPYYSPLPVPCTHPHHLTQPFPSPSWHHGTGCIPPTPRPSIRCHVKITLAWALERSRVAHPFGITLFLLSRPYNCLSVSYVPTGCCTTTPLGPKPRRSHERIGWPSHTRLSSLPSLPRFGPREALAGSTRTCRLPAPF